MGAKRKAKKDFAKEQELAKLRAAEERKQASKSAANRLAAAKAAAAAKERQERLAAMSATERASFERNETRAGMALLFAGLALLGGCIYLGSQGSDSSDGSDRPAAAQGEGSDEPDLDQDEMEFTAFEMCKDFVEDQLKSPGSATFRNFFEDDGEVQVSGSGRGPYEVVSSVDAENSFGAKPRIPFSCTVTNTEGDTWRLVDINLVE